MYKFGGLTELNISNNQLDDLPVTLVSEEKKEVMFLLKKKKKIKVAITSLHLLVLDGNPFGAIPDTVERRGVPMWHYLIACAQELSEQNAQRKQNSGGQ